MSRACETCAMKPGEINHPTGMIFVGWALCPDCGGSGQVPAPVPDHLKTPEQRIDVALGILRDAVARGWDHVVQTGRVLSAIRALNGEAEPTVVCPWCSRGSGIEDTRCPECGMTMCVPVYGVRR